MLLLGWEGMPRRYYDYLPQFRSLHLTATFGSWILIAGLILMFVNLFRGLFKGEKAGDNPWDGVTLEWQIPSPPPTENFRRSRSSSMAPMTLRSLKKMDEAKAFNFEEVKDDTGARLGMWLFLLSEILLFGGMFILYSAYRYKNPIDFHHASQELEVLLGNIEYAHPLDQQLNHGDLHCCHSKGTTKIVQLVNNGHDHSRTPVPDEQGY